MANRPAFEAIAEGLAWTVDGDGVIQQLSDFGGDTAQAG
jgi:hypothetical protein